MRCAPLALLSFLLVGCAPIIDMSTRDRVMIRYTYAADQTEAQILADKECQKHGRSAFLVDARALPGLDGLRYTFDCR